MAQFQIGLRSIVSSQRVVYDRIVQLTVWIDHGRLYRFALQAGISVLAIPARMESKESRLNIGFVGDHMPTSLPSAVGDRLTTLGLTVRGYPAPTASARVHLSAT